MGRIRFARHRNLEDYVYIRSNGYVYYQNPIMESPKSFGKDVEAANDEARRQNLQLSGDREQVRAKKRKEDHDTGIWRAFSAARGRAASSKSIRYRRNVKYTLTREQEEKIIARAGGRCELTGIEFNMDFVPGCHKAPYKPSLDRIDSRKNYTYRNVRLVCAAANLALGEWGDEVFDRLARSYVETKNGR